MSASRGRPPGTPKTGGRGRGTPNRNTSAARERLTALGCDPIAEIVGIAKDPKTEPSLRVSIYSLLIRHTIPVPRAVDVTETPESTIEKSTMTEQQAIRLASLVMETFGPNSERYKKDAEKHKGPDDNRGPDEHSSEG